MHKRMYCAQVFTHVARNERAPDSAGSENGGIEEDGEKERGARGRVRGWPVARVPARVRE